MIDIHCHILPDVDDGARSWEMALAMCAMAREDGIEQIVATPHANDVYFYERSALQRLVDDLNQKLGGCPSILLGCDFHFSYDNIEEAVETPSQFTIGGTPYMLVEFSDYSLPPTVDDNLAKLINLGLKPIVTHPERNPLIQRRPDRVLDWIRGGCLIQVTGNSLTGHWGKTAQNIAEWLLRNQAVHFLASDGHNITTRKPTLKRARQAAAVLVGEAVAEALVTLNPRAAINGEPII
jgi:protein-tyrosine phosphatase